MRYHVSAVSSPTSKGIVPSVVATPRPYRLGSVLLGAFYGLGSIVTAPKLGAATLVVLILAQQAVASLLVDHFG